MAMLSRQLRRACLDSSWTLPPTFLLPFTANLATVSHSTEAGNVSDVLTNSGAHLSHDTTNTIRTSQFPPAAPASKSAPALPSPASDAATPPTPIALSPSIRELLPLLRAQGAHYITAHIYDRPYLLTAGDTVRLPFLMHGVHPGDVLRLNRASNIGSRDFTLKAAAKDPRTRSPTSSTVVIADPTPGSGLASHSRVMPSPRPSALIAGVVDGGEQGSAAPPVPHFVAHQAKGKTPYLDERLFVCRAVVMGVEAEPLRTKEKTKRRQRRVKTVTSKHKFTVLRIKELVVRSVDEVEAGGDAVAA